MFYVNLDEIDVLTKRLWMLSRNKFNFFSFRDKEHLQLPTVAGGKPDTTKNTKEQITEYLKQNNIDIRGGKIMLLTNMNILGYNFNPVSFYYCFDKNDQSVCAIAEVSNTFREMKPYFMGPDKLQSGSFALNTQKHFYVSPFMDHDAFFDFHLRLPDEKLNIRIDNFTEGERIFISTLTGIKKELTNGRLFWYSIRFPFLTLKVITLIHWHALLLWIKKIPFHKKEAHPDLQRDVFRKYEKSK
jgi:DUF1365 family protein